MSFSSVAVAGLPRWLTPELRCILAPNPSALTGPGTNSYLLGAGGGLALIDPGPALEAHYQALLGALAPGERIERIIVTHAHYDHSELAGRISGATGAPVLAFGDAKAGRNPALTKLQLGGGEGADASFRPDINLQDGASIEGDGWALEALHTPGHMGNHLCLRWGEHLFSGDHVMGWSTSLVSPPDGCMSDYVASLQRLARLELRAGFAGHGAPVADLPARINALIAHRQARETSIRAALQSLGPATAETLATAVYTDVAKAMLPAATRNVLAHLIDLRARGLCECLGELREEAIFAAD